MKPLCFYSVLFITLILFTSCQKDAPMQPAQQSSQAVTFSKAEQTALQLINQSGWKIDEETGLVNASERALKKASSAGLAYFQRRPLCGNIVHYEF